MFMIQIGVHQALVLMGDSQLLVQIKEVRHQLMPTLPLSLLHKMQPRGRMGGHVIMWLLPLKHLGMRYCIKDWVSVTMM